MTTSRTPPLFTVLTATYNRAHTLPRTHAALCAQTLQDFEWVIVDDGSGDGTEALVAGWIREGRIAIRYFRQENGGKHVACNLGVREARGELLATLDSDDTCVPDALERMARHWEAIEASRRDEFSGVTGLCVDPEGRVLGAPFPHDAIDASPLELIVRGWYVGDKWGCHRTALLKEQPFPVFPGERFISEGVVWNRLAARYKVRFVNEPLRVVEYLPDGISAQSLGTRVRAPRGAMLYYREFAQYAVPWRWRLRSLVNLGRFALHAGESLPRTIAAAGFPHFLPAVAPLAVTAWLRDRWLLAKERR